GDANLGSVHGTLRAFAASDISIELWNSGGDAAHDDAGLFAKFCAPTIANGKVYMASFSGQLNVYGLRSSICSVSASATAMSFPAGGSSGSVDVSAAPDCMWAVVSNAQFISINSQSSDSGAGTVTFTVSPNSGPPRTGTIAIADWIVTISQEGACSTTINPGGKAFKKGGGTGAINVTSDGSCTWNAVSSDDWITIASGNSSTGPGRVEYSV